VLDGGLYFKSEKLLQRLLWEHWSTLNRLPPYGFLDDVELTEYEWWVQEPAREGRTDFLAFDRRLSTHVVVEVKRCPLDPPAVMQAASYIQPAEERLNCPTYALLIGSAISRQAMDAFYAIEAPMRIALMMVWPGGMRVIDPTIFQYGENNREIALGYLRNVSGHSFVPDGNPAMADFITKREKVIWRELRTWEPER